MPEILTVGETARLLNISERTVREWADAGKLPVQRTSSGQRLFNRDELEPFRPGRLSRPKAKRP